MHGFKDVNDVSLFICRPLHLAHWGLPAHTLQWHHNGHDSVSNHQASYCLVRCLFRRRSTKISKLHVTGLSVACSIPCEPIKTAYSKGTGWSISTHGNAVLYVKSSFAKWCPFCLRLDLLIVYNLYTQDHSCPMWGPLLIRKMPSQWNMKPLRKYKNMCQPFGLGNNTRQLC